MSQKDDRKCMTPKFRAAFAHVFKPQDPMNEGEDPKYGITMLFDKDADLSALKAAAKAAAVEKWGPDKNDWPDNVRLPFRDQGEKKKVNKETGKVVKDDDGRPVLLDGFQAGATFVSATSKQKPGVVDADVNDIIEPSEFYSGCYARATIRAFTYQVKGNVGIGFGLDNIQKLADGEPLGGGKPDPQADFSPASKEPIGADDDDDPVGGSSGTSSAADLLG